MGTLLIILAILYLFAGLALGMAAKEAVVDAPDRYYAYSLWVYILFWLPIVIKGVWLMPIDPSPTESSPDSSVE